MSDVRVRFAPSPTGYLHVGGARTALFNYLLAKNLGGSFILRVEDTDKVRSTEEAEAMQLQDMKWLGLNWDEGPDKPGEYGPYRQSERQLIYQNYAHKLIDEKKAYYCFCTDEVLEEKKEKAFKEGRPPQYDGTCRYLSEEEVQDKKKQGLPCAVRFWIKEQKPYTISDLIRGDVTFQEGMVGDFIILRSDGMPVYNFCCVIDDALMKITHVLRGEDHLSNTVRQVMIYEALDFDIPKFGHMSMVLGSDKQKLSKRHGASSVNDFKEKGFMHEALINFIALLGWSSPDDREVVPFDEMIKLFSIDRVNASPAVFDDVKLKWMNSVYLRNLSHDKLWELLLPFLNKAGLDFSDATPEWIDKALGAFKTSFETLQEAVPLFEHLCDKNFSVADESAEVLGWPDSKKVIETWKKALSQAGEFVTADEFGKIQKEVQKESGVKGKNLFMPLRVAIIGKPQGTELKQLVPLLSTKSLMARADKTLGV